MDDNQKILDWINNNGLNHEFMGGEAIPENLLSIVAETCNDAVITYNGIPKFVVIDHILHPIPITEKDLQFNTEKIIKIVDYNSLTPSYITEGYLRSVALADNGNYMLTINI